MKKGLFIADIVVIVVAFLVVFWVRSALPLEGLAHSFVFYLPFIYFAVGVFVVSFAAFGFYSGKKALFSISYFVDFLRALSLWGFFLIAFSYFTKVDYSRFILILFFLLSSFLLYVLRIILAWAFGDESYGKNDEEIVETAKAKIEYYKNSHGSEEKLIELQKESDAGLIYESLKRMFDIIVSITGIILSVPFYPLIIYLIKKDSQGKSFINQERVGENGKIFKIYKFRTMQTDTELYAYAPREGGDERITKIGRILRRFSIDELPQLLNVLKGDMSIVGPRPEMPFIVEKYEDWQKLRLNVKPGITGLWQILGRKNLPLYENLEYDLYYVFHQSFFLDIAIILKTFPHLFIPKGAY